MHNATVDSLLDDPRIWRPGQRRQTARAPSLGTGYSALDAALPDRGWPLGTLAEIFHEQPGMGELRVILPTLADLTQRHQWLALVGPPYIPYAPGLAYAGIDLSRVLLIHPRAHEDHLWAAEQALRSGTCGAVAAWPQEAGPTALRRLQLAAEAGSSWAALFRPREAASQPSPAAIRLAVARAAGENLDIEILKCRGGHPCRLSLDASEPAAASGNRVPGGAQPRRACATTKGREDPRREPASAACTDGAHPEAISPPPREGRERPAERQINLPL